MIMLSFLFSRRSEARSNRKDRGRKSFRRVKSSRLGFEPLESRQLLSVAAATTFTINIPKEVANAGVQLAIYSNPDNNYLVALDGTVNNINSVTSGYLPLISLAAAGTTTAISKTVTIPAASGFDSGEMFIFVGADQYALPINGGLVSAAKAAVDANTAGTSYNFAMIEFTYLPSADPTQSVLNIDTSAIDSTGFPFTIVYPESADLAYPLSTLGITLSETALNKTFTAAFSDTGVYADYSEFEQCATYAQEQQSSSAQTQNLQVVAPQDILSAESAGPTMNQATINTGVTSTLLSNCDYYYVVTAFSANEVGSTGVLGQTLPSKWTHIAAGSVDSTKSISVSWDEYYDPNTIGYNIYRFCSNDGTVPTDSTVYSLVGTVYGKATTGYTDAGAIAQAEEISSDTATNYGFNPLSEYYSQEVLTFFNQYTDTDSFSIYRDGVYWVGNTTNYAPTSAWNTTGESYTMLRLRATNSYGAIVAGDMLNIYQPFFSTNTIGVIDDAPTIPSWLSADAYETPAEMVFGCDGVFASNKVDPDLNYNGDHEGAIADIENSIVSALNRGIATTAGITPDNWAAFPTIASAPAVASATGSTLAAGTYYYVVTAVNGANETTPSLEVSATVTESDSQGVTLTWTNSTNALPGVTYTYNIYRGTSVDDLTLYATTAAGVMTYTDTGAGDTSSETTPPFTYFAEESTSNWYAAVVQSNSTLDPANGVSLNGLSYGFPYSDQGGLSTDINFVGKATFPTNITINLGSYVGPTFMTQTLGDATAGSTYSQTLTVSGQDATNTQYQVISGPSCFEMDGNVLTCSDVTAAVGNYTLVIQASNSTGTVQMAFPLTVNATAESEADATTSETSSSDDVQASAWAPITIETTSLPRTITGSYSQQLTATGGQGELIFSVYDGQLPAEVQLMPSGLLTGTVTEDTNYEFTVKVNDAYGNRAYQHYDLIVVGVTIRVPYLAANATTLVIEGTGFDADSPSSNVVTLSSSGCTATVTEATSTQLTVALTGPLDTGNLTATVTVDDQATVSTFVANVIAASTPGVTENTDCLAANGTTLVINGSGFDTNTMYGSNSVALTAGGEAVTVESVTVNSSSQLTVTVDDLPTPASGGVALMATVMTDGTPSASKQVATIVAAEVPAVIDSSQNQLYNNVTSLTIYGSGFKPSIDGAWSSAISVTLSTTASQTETFDSSDITVVSDNEITINTVNFGSWSGNLNAQITINGVVGEDTQIACLTKVTATTTTVVLPNSNNFSITGTTLILNGFGFTSDSTVALQCYSTTNGYVPVTGFTPNCDSPTQIRLTDLDLSSYGTIKSLCAVVTNRANGPSSVSPGPIVATIVSTSNQPTITSATTSISGYTTTLTITGTNFDVDGTNYVTLYTSTDTADALPIATIASTQTGGGIQNVVVSDDGTLLTVTLAGRLPTGALYATVVSDGISSGTPVQIDNVATLAPVITGATTAIPEDAVTLTITGTGFDLSGPNTVLLYSADSPTPLPADQIVSVIADSKTQLTVTLNTAMSLTADSLSASVSAHSTSGEPAVTIGQVVSSAPTIDYVATNLAASPGASTLTEILVITGTNLASTAPAKTAVTLYTLAETIPSTDMTVSVNEAGTEITVTFAANYTLPVGQLYASVTTSVTTSLTTSNTVVVATVLSTSVTPSITPTNTKLATSATKVVITGSNFDTTAGGVNLVQLTSGTITSSVVDPTGTQLTVYVTADTLSDGPLSAQVTVDGVATAWTPVATVSGSDTPTVAPATTNYVPTNATTLVINGTGFDPDSYASNVVTLSSGVVKNVSVNSTGTQLTVTLDPGSALSAGEVTAVVTVNGISSGSAVQVATAVAVPTITPVTTSWTAGPTTLYITGTNFSSTDDQNDVLLYDSNGKSLGTATIVSATSVKIGVTLTNVPAGVLYATVTVDGIATSAKATIATVTPSVTARTTGVAQTANTLNITGAGFDTTASNNVVILYSGTTKLGTATVTVPGSTQLTIQLSNPPLGALSAVVYVNGVASAKTQVATITGPASAATSTLTASATTIVAPDSIAVTMQAKDANGYNITTGGLNVTFALTSTSAGGKFSAVTDNHNGTYTVAFTGTTMGSSTITAKINGAQLTATAPVTVKFQSSFSGTGKIGGRWAVQPGFGTFTVGSNVATAGAAANNIAIYNSKCPANVSASVTVSNLVNGSFAGVVARYTASGFYRAGILKQNGQLYAVIEKATFSGTGKFTTKRLATQKLGALGTVTFQTVGSSLKLSINAVVLTATDSTYKSGSVGILGSSGTKFASFLGTVSSSSASLRKTATPCLAAGMDYYTAKAIRTGVEQ
jgi:hypothetical protein